ncbi:MAG: M28 family peptidase [Promethearchaeota archaeon]|nr:MAG: M28 family peptidase [Candidatus Lokiarchaeota archaeon]
MQIEEDLSFRVWKDPKNIPFIQNDMHKFLVKICEEAGPREPGGFGERKATKILKDELQIHCDKVSIEKFPVAPLAFLSFTVISPVLILLGLLFYWSYPIISVFAILIASMVFILMFIRYTAIFDVFFPRRSSHNVIGEINPKKEWKQTVMFSGHLDSAYQFNLNRFMPKTFGLYLIGYPAIVIVFFIVSLSHLIIGYNGIFGQVVPLVGFKITGIIFAVLIVPMSFVLLFFKTLYPVMGAMDNLSGIAIVQGIAKSIGTDKELTLNHTKLLVIGFGSEEAGLRGSKAWVKRNFEKYSEKPFYFINFDTVAKSDSFNVFSRELTMGVKYDPKTVDKVISASEKLGLKIKKGILPFGATDGAALVQGGLKNGTTIEALNMDNPITLKIYHTVDDTADEVEPKALEMGRDIGLEFLKIIDKS